MDDMQNELREIREIIEDIQDGMPRKNGIASTVNLLLSIGMMLAALYCSLHIPSTGIVLAVVALVFYLESRIA